MLNQSGSPLDKPMQFIKGVGPKLAGLLEKKGISTVEDALYFIPRAYEDRRKVTPIHLLRRDSATTVMGMITSKITKSSRSRNRYEVSLSDKTGTLQLVWFHVYPKMLSDLVNGNRLLVYGTAHFFNGRCQMVHPDYEVVQSCSQSENPVSQNFGRILPVYSETEGLHQGTIRRIIASALRLSLSGLEDPLPQSMRIKHGLPTLRESFLAVHYPKDPPLGGFCSPALKRVIFEEFFVLQLGLGLKKNSRRQHTAPILEDRKQLRLQFLNSLPFRLTADQSTTLSETITDLGKPCPMTRLVQGDVGSGKTVVALAAACTTIENQFQTAFMAPTEILAQQHYQIAKQWLGPLGVRIEILSHGSSGKSEIREAISKGNIDLVVGTHALFQEGVVFSRLGLVIVDEQHRFGVEQRTELIRKGSGQIPHLLMMTATPIPRTLALTLYGDLDLSIIREKPAGRQKVMTSILRGRDRTRLYQKIRNTVSRGAQVYIIYPLVENSEKLELKSATQMYQKLSREVFREYKLALLHGRMKPEEKEGILQDFKQGKSHILVSTTVIEVGIDVPNATLMVIEHPERLGLSQLHQLRGRVGRGTSASECVLIAENFVTERLRVLQKTDDGFEIAEEDLKIRGPGEFLGTRQHGLPGFRVGHILRDASLLALARTEAESILERDPSLKDPEYAGIRKMVESRWRDKIERLRTG